MADGAAVTREQDTDDASLVRRCQAGDRHALHLLYNRHHGYLYAVVRRLAGQDADAEDVVQETFVRAWKALPKFRAEASFRTWLLQIGVNLCRNMFRRRKPTVPMVELAAPSSEADTLARQWLDQALAQLSSRYREVLVLHDVMELRHGEIAEILGLSVGTSKSQLHRARVKMRDLLLTNSHGPSAARAGEARSLR
ncbi:MAG: RNA polymerase sigma factor [Myxococcota bacterium]|nr:RNA polymerase sigma factor [Myxococcota bacterium]